MKRRLLAPFLGVIALLLVELFLYTFQNSLEILGRLGTHFSAFAIRAPSFKPAQFLIALALGITPNLYLFFRDRGRQRNQSGSTPLAPIDSLLSFLDPLLPARTMIEVGGDVRENIALLHDQGASPWQIRSHFALGVLFILVDATREALAIRRKKKR